MAKSPKSGLPVGLARDGLLQQLDQIINALQRRKLTDQAVHGARKGVTRSRAILRLLRHVVGNLAYRRENKLLRDAGRPLTALRDAKVLIETLQQLRQSMPLARLLKQELDRCRERLSPQRVHAVTARLRDVKRQLKGIDQETLERMITRKDMDRVYRKGRSAFAEACRSATDERLHEWRKQVKYLLHQIELVREFGVRHLAQSRRQADRLAETLGDDHDLAVLRNKIRGFVAAGKLHRPDAGHNGAPNGSPAGSLERRLERRRAALQRRARTLGSSLFAAKRHLIKKWSISKPD